MAEKKKCPFRKTEHEEAKASPVGGTEFYKVADFGDCIEDKCAWWIPPGDPNRPIQPKDGGCALYYLGMFA